MGTKITIITLTLNSERFLEKTIKSVVSQSYKNIEYIIIDGGSNDDTLNIIKRYDEEIDLWISGPDKGISDAMNKGVALATGDYILFLHSDDYLVDSAVIEKASQFFYNKAEIYFFPVILKSVSMTKLSPARSFSFLTNFKMGSCHQGQLCSRKLFRNIGGFSLKYTIVMDYDFILRAYRYGAKTSSITKFPLSVMRLSGISSKTDWGHLKIRFQEERQVHFRNCPSSSMRFLYFLYWRLYLPYRRIRFLTNRKSTKASCNARYENQ